MAAASTAGGHFKGWLRTHRFFRAFSLPSLGCLPGERKEGSEPPTLLAFFCWPFFDILTEYRDEERTGAVAREK
jgi:hypothetical protein